MGKADKSVAQIKQELKGADASKLSVFIKEHGTDARAGVQSLIKRAKKKIADYEKEVKRTYDLKKYEREYAGCGVICGIDEAGRGPLAGPVAAAAAVLPKDCGILYINDSKKLSPRMREKLYDVIMEKAVAVGIAFVSPERIDEINILQATYEAMRKAIKQLDVVPDILLNDAVTIPGVAIRQVPIVKGDAKSISIGAASIMAKVARDRLMMEYDTQFPEYGFASHKGYGTAAHIAAIKQYGPSPIHRKSFIKNFLD